MSPKLMGLCQVCDERVAVHRHHRKMRSQGGSDESVNLLRVCAECHASIHANPSDAYARGLLVHSWADPALVRMFLATPELDPPMTHQEMSDAWQYTEEAITGVLSIGHVEEGTVCPTCERRKPHKKKASSPKSKVFSTRIPLDDVETFNEIVDAAAEHHGLKAKPHHVYWTLLYAVTLLLQQEKGELPV